MDYRRCAYGTPVSTTWKYDTWYVICDMWYVDCAMREFKCVGRAMNRCCRRRFVSFHPVYVHIIRTERSRGAALLFLFFKKNAGDAGRFLCVCAHYFVLFYAYFVPLQTCYNNRSLFC